LVQKLCVQICVLVITILLRLIVWNKRGKFEFAATLPEAGQHISDRSLLQWMLVVDELLGLGALLFVEHIQSDSLL